MRLLEERVMVQILQDERVCQEKMGVGQRGKGIDIMVPSERWPYLV